MLSLSELVRIYVCLAPTDNHTAVAKELGVAGRGAVNPPVAVSNGRKKRDTGQHSCKPSRAL